MGTARPKCSQRALSTSSRTSSQRSIWIWLGKANTALPESLAKKRPTWKRILALLDRLAKMASPQANTISSREGSGLVASAVVASVSGVESASEGSGPAG